MVPIDPDKVITVSMIAQAFKCQQHGTTAPRDMVLPLRMKRSIKISYVLSDYSPTHLTIDLLRVIEQGSVLTIK